MHTLYLFMCASIIEGQNVYLCSNWAVSSLLKDDFRRFSQRFECTE